MFCLYITEAQIRFLKAKLRVMQEEMDRLGQECNKKVRFIYIPGKKITTYFAFLRNHGKREIFISRRNTAK